MKEETKKWLQDLDARLKEVEAQVFKMPSDSQIAEMMKNAREERIKKPPVTSHVNVPPGSGVGDTSGEFRASFPVNPFAKEKAECPGVDPAYYGEEKLKGVCECSSCAINRSYNGEEYPLMCEKKTKEFWDQAFPKNTPINKASSPGAEAKPCDCWLCQLNKTIDKQDFEVKMATGTREPSVEKLTFEDLKKTKDMLDKQRAEFQKNWNPFESMFEPGLLGRDVCMCKQCRETRQEVLKDSRHGGWIDKQFEALRERILSNNKKMEDSIWKKSPAEDLLKEIKRPSEFTVKTSQATGWYFIESIHGKNNLIYFKDGKGLYGIERHGIWVSYENECPVGRSSKASNEEVLRRLEEVAKGKGFVPGAKIEMRNGFIIVKNPDAKYELSPDGSCFFLGSACILSSEMGRWAELIQSAPSETMEARCNGWYDVVPLGFNKVDLVFFKDNKCLYGITFEGEWRSDFGYAPSMKKPNYSSLRLVDNKIAEARLYDYAKKNGFIPNAKFKSITNPSLSHRTTVQDVFHLCEDGTTLLLGGVPILKDGKWAEVELTEGYKQAIQADQPKQEAPSALFDPKGIIEGLNMIKKKIENPKYDDEVICLIDSLISVLTVPTTPATPEKTITIEELRNILFSIKEDAINMPAESVLRTINRWLIKYAF